MMNFFTNIDEIINTFLLNIGIWGPIIGCILILFESVLPILPLFVFITINFLSFGVIIGFIISWFFTCLGCLMSFMIFRKGIKTHLLSKTKDDGKLKKVLKIIDKITLEQLTLIIAIPFTPAFLVNIAAGLSKISFKKYFIALLIGKIFMVFFWGFVGTSLLQSLTNKIALLKVVALVTAAYIISKLVSKKFDIE